MRKSFIGFFAIALLFYSSSLFAQVSVNPLTGTASAVIPVYTISSGGVSLPISLSYSAIGVKPKDVEGTAGMGWQLNAGGQISRQLHGIPDDQGYDNSSHFSIGWMKTPAYTYINGFTPANNGTCTNETTDLTYINNYLAQANQDTEPDIFYVNAPGLSCQLVYSRDSSKFMPVIYQDLVITYAKVGGTGSDSSHIASFTITNDRGVKYVFAAPEYVTQTTSLDGGTVHYLSTRYQQYQNGVTFADAWNLTSITDPNGNGIQLTYTSALNRDSTDPVLLYIGGSTTASLQYDVKQTVTPQVLNTITTFNAVATNIPACSFTWTPLSGNMDTKQTIIGSITGYGHTFKFTYSAMQYTPTGFSRSFLRNYADQGCSSPSNYTFSYLGETLPGTTLLPDSMSTQNDYWGYYTTHASASNLIPSVYINPSDGTKQRYAIKVPASLVAPYQYTLSNSDRSADATVISYGTLNQITTAQGGTTTLTYEPNDYLDVPSNTTVQGGGIRVKQMVISNGPGSTNDITTNYTYLNPSTSLSSGKPVTLPAYAFTIPIGGTLSSLGQCTSATAFSGYDLSTEDHTIMYTDVKVSITGAGYTTYNYYIPATNWDANAHPACSGCTTSDWSPTIDYSARVFCSAQTVKNDIYSYPFIPNPNYDFERGLPVKEINYTDGGSERSETNYTYQRSYTNPLTITGFKVDDNNTITYSTKGYDLYKINYRISELPATVNTKVYASTGSGQLQSGTVNYFFNSIYHKLITKQTSVNSDNSTVTTNFSYVKDYSSATTGTNQYVTALAKLRQENINAPVETYQQVTRAATTVTTAASLTLFTAFTFGGMTLYLPYHQLKIVQPDGAAFTPYAVSGSAQTSVYDSKYFFVANFDNYDNAGYPQTVDDANKNIQTTFSDHYTNQPTAMFSNAATGEVAYNDFDSHFASSVGTFNITGTGSYTPVGSHAGNAAGLTTTQTVTSTTLTKNAIAQNYIFSIWINTVTAGTLTVSIAGTTPPAISFLTGGWKYYEIKIPVGTLASSYTVSFTSNQNISIDDILFYPDVATAATSTYDPLTRFKLDATNTNGVSVYYKSDTWGRPLYAYDQDHNILKKDSYISALDAQAFYGTTIIGTGDNQNTNTPINLSILQTNTCIIANATYTWDFGDGTTPPVTTTGTAPTHMYLEPNTYTITLTINSALFGKLVITTPIVIAAGPNVNISYTNFTTSNGNIATVKFVGTVHTYSFTAAQLPGAQVQKDNYAIVIHMAAGSLPYNGSTGYGGLEEGGDYPGIGACQAYSSTNTYSFGLDLTNCNNLNIAVHTDNPCE